MNMLDDKTREALDQIIDRTKISFHTLMFSIRIDKVDFHIQYESDYATGLAHRMILTGFISDFKFHNEKNLTRKRRQRWARFFLEELKS